MASSENAYDGGIPVNPLAELRAEFIDERTGELNFEKTIMELIGYVLSIDEGLDISNIKRYSISRNYAGMMQELGEELGRDLTPTMRDGNSGFAMLVSTKDGDILALDAAVLEATFAEDIRALHTAINMIHHELCHAHDNAVKRSTLIHEYFNLPLEGMRGVLTPIAMAVWDEYYACRRSSTTLYEGKSIHAAVLPDAIANIDREIQEAIHRYRYDSKLDSLLATVKQGVNYLFQMIGYAQGVLAGVGGNMPDDYADAWSRIEPTYVGKIWTQLSDSLDKLYIQHSTWGSIEVMKPIEGLAWSLMCDLGVIFRETPKGLYAEVPIRWGRK